VVIFIGYCGERTCCKPGRNAKEKLMKIAVIGSRSFNDAEKLQSVLNEYSPTEIISGGAIGAEQLAAAYAEEKGIPMQEFFPEYNKYGRSAPIRRNDQIVNASDIVVAFWDGESRGTKYTINYAKKRKKVVRCILFSK
jgi:hypothetical protein